MPHSHTLLEALRRRGFRVTPQREMIIEVITRGVRHLTAEDIYGEVQRKSRALNLATVYRTLDLLVEEGLVSRSDLGRGREVYATIRHGPHIHLVCRRCGRVIEADGSLVEPLSKRIEEQYGFSGDLQHLSIPGLCSDCWPDHERREE